MTTPNAHYWIQYEAMPRHWRCIHCELVNYDEGRPSKCHCEMNYSRPWWSGVFWTAIGSFAGIFIIFVVMFAIRYARKAIYG